MEPRAKMMMTVVLCAATAMADVGCGLTADGVPAADRYRAAVPDDRVQPLGFKVTDYPTFEELAGEFKRAHQRSEKIRNSDGSWSKGYGDRFDPPVYHPLARDTARRVLGYIDAHLVTGEAIYRQRAKEGLEYLLKEQQPDGQFIWWREPKGRTGGGSSLYVTAIPAAAFVEGYKLFKDKRYLEAANKACDYICTVPIERGIPPRVFTDTNANYNLFASWALAANYEVTKNDFYLDRAQSFAWSVTYKQLPSGMWSDEHNQEVGYQEIIVRGLATLLSVMPEDDPHRYNIEKATYRALNHLRLRQKPDGSIIFRPGGSRTKRRARAFGIVALRLNWPVMDSVRLAAKGVRGNGGIMGIGSLMRAYKCARKAKSPKTPKPSSKRAETGSQNDSKADSEKLFHTPVPENRVQPLGFKVGDYPIFEEIVQGFERAHQRSEKIYNGDGSWGKGYGKSVDPPVYHPLVRDTAMRVLAYIDAWYVTNQAIYRQRAKEGLEYLLREQRKDGQFIWWYGDPKKGRIGGGTSLFDTSYAAAALLEGYKLFKDRRYLEAANKACDYICTVSVERGIPPRVFVDTNANYNLFASWALAVNYEVTRNEFYLDRAQRFAWSVIYKQLPSGMWSDEHNQEVWYQEINLRGLATLLSVMPENDPHRHNIEKATYKALNHLRLRQKPDGSVIFRPGDTKTKIRRGDGFGEVALRLNWPVSDSLHLVAKGTRGSGGTMGTGSLMRAYRHLERADRPAGNSFAIGPGKTTNQKKQKEK